MKKKYLTILQIVDKIADITQSNPEPAEFHSRNLSVLDFFGFCNGVPVIPDAETTPSVLLVVVLQNRKGYN